MPGGSGSDAGMSPTSSARTGGPDRSDLRSGARCLTGPRAFGWSLAMTGANQAFLREALRATALVASAGIAQVNDGPLTGRNATGRTARRLAPGAAPWLSAGSSSRSGSRGARLARRRGRFALVVLGLGAAAGHARSPFSPGRWPPRIATSGARWPRCRTRSEAVRVNWFSVGGQVGALRQARCGRCARSCSRVLLDEAGHRYVASTARASSPGAAPGSAPSTTARPLGAVCAQAACRIAAEPEHCEVLVIAARRIPNVPACGSCRSARATCARATLFGDAVPRATLGQSAFVRDRSRATTGPRRRRSCWRTGSPGSTARRCSRLVPQLRVGRPARAWLGPLCGRANALATRIEHARSVLQATGLRVRAVGSGRRASRGSGRGDGLRPPAVRCSAGGRGAPARLRGAGGGAAPPRRGCTSRTATPLRAARGAGRSAFSSSPSRRRWRSAARSWAGSRAPAVAGGRSRADRRAGRVPSAPLGALRAAGSPWRVLLAAAATLVLAAALTVRPVAVRRARCSRRSTSRRSPRSSWSSIALVARAADTGDLLASNGTGIVLLLLPSLVGFAAAVGAARLLPAGLRGCWSAWCRETPSRSVWPRSARAPARLRGGGGRASSSSRSGSRSSPRRTARPRARAAGTGRLRDPRRRRRPRRPLAARSGPLGRHPWGRALAPARARVEPVIRLASGNISGATDVTGIGAGLPGRRCGDRRLARRFRVELACGAGGAARAEAAGRTARRAAAGRREEARVADRGHRHRGRAWPREHPTARRSFVTVRARPQRRYPPTAPGRSDPPGRARRHPPSPCASNRRRSWRNAEPTPGLPPWAPSRSGARVADGRVD